MGVFIRSLKNSFTLSLLIHALVLLVGVIMLRERAAHPPAKLTWIELDPLPANPIHTKKSQNENDQSKRVVQSDLGRQTDRAAPDAFLGERTQTVDRETVNQNKSTQVGKTAQAKPQGSAAPKAEAPSAASPLSRLGVAILPAVPVKPMTEHNRAMELLRERAKGAFQVNPQELANGDGSPSEYIKGLKEGETTALNTKEYVFFSYFQRIRQRLDLAWSGALREKLIRFYRTGRQLASEMDHTTRVLVTLNSIGEIKQVEVVEESGTRVLDEAAVKAFNQAGPFPNPPRGILDPTGLIKIRWDFILKT